jgi:hypothetical protein
MRLYEKSQTPHTLNLFYTYFVESSRKLHLKTKKNEINDDYAFFWHLFSFYLYLTDHDFRYAELWFKKIRFDDS